MGFNMQLFRIGSNMHGKTVVESHFNLVPFCRDTMCEYHVIMNLFCNAGLHKYSYLGYGYIVIDCRNIKF